MTEVGKSNFGVNSQKRSLGLLLSTPYPPRCSMRPWVDERSGQSLGVNCWGGAENRDSPSLRKMNDRLETVGRSAAKLLGAL